MRKSKAATQSKLGNADSPTAPSRWLGVATGLASLGVLVGSEGCIRDPDCGVCDPDKLVLESMTSLNYANRTVHILAPGIKKSEFFVEEIGPCEESEEATGDTAKRGADEWCKISPLVNVNNLDLVFNNLLKPESIELVRKQPDQPSFFQTYGWKHDIVKIEGPISRITGDYRRDSDGHRMLEPINLTCAHNYEKENGEPLTHEVLQENPDVCNGFHEEDGQTLPLRTQLGTTRSYEGELDWRVGSCATPDDGPDTCCSDCDYELSVNVWKYGQDESGKRLNANVNLGHEVPDGDVAAIECDAEAGNPFEQCKDFIPYVNREYKTRRYTFDWNGKEITRKVPKFDYIRETHPDERPEEGIIQGPACQSTSECESDDIPEMLGSSGAQCVGKLADGTACERTTANGEECQDAICIPEWFVTCNAINEMTGSQGYCVDRRYRDATAGGCHVIASGHSAYDCGQTGFADLDSCSSLERGQKLARCDEYENGTDRTLIAEECCAKGLGVNGENGDSCDPIYLAGSEPIDIFERNYEHPEEVRNCRCPVGDDAPEEGCEDLVERLCPGDDASEDEKKLREGTYAVKHVTKVGGVVYDPSVKGVQIRLADRGRIPRSKIEGCAAGAGAIGGLTRLDGWRGNDQSFFESLEDFDRGMCSGSEYTVVFASGDEDGSHVIEDKVGNKLKESRYKFETPQFHVRPGSGFPTDNLRIGACDEFELSFSNKFDLSPENLAKIVLVQLDPNPDAPDKCNNAVDVDDPECWEESDYVVAGGPNCVNTKEELDAGGGDVPPCLTMDISDHQLGTIRMRIDSTIFGAQLFFERDDGQAVDAFGRPASGRYRMLVPGLKDAGSLDELNLNNSDDVENYNQAFHDICGMPLITEGATDFYYDFSIDQPKCKEDLDGDGIQLSCDNADDFPNPLQENFDGDAFGDIEDLCPVTPGMNNKGDTDNDGVGNDCDTCSRKPDSYNDDELGLVGSLVVRNIPFQSDWDRDGIGDVCDNCITVPNCENYGLEEDGEGLEPHTVGDPTSEDENKCQRDNDGDLLGNACDPTPNSAAISSEDLGAIGFGPMNDFDQDGVVNDEDLCPRQPIVARGEERPSCTSDEDCGENTKCAETATGEDGVRYCNHVDTDGDNVGDICDNCPAKANPDQIVIGSMEDDDPDADFVGSVCETDDSCADHTRDSRPFGFYEVSANGYCCVTAYPGDGRWEQTEEETEDGDPIYKCVGLCDPDGIPVMKDDCGNEDKDYEPGDGDPIGRAQDGSTYWEPSDPEVRAKIRTEDPKNYQFTCRKLGAGVLETPGVVNLPAGCEEALEAAGIAVEDANEQNPRLSINDIEDKDELWSKMCFLPQWDQDFDGLGDLGSCDLCPFDYDPFNLPYVDPVTGKVWEMSGRYCNGDYEPEKVCEREAAEEGEGEGETGDGETGGEEAE